jgi:hypothetical protein
LLSPKKFEKPLEALKESSSSTKTPKFFKNTSSSATLSGSNYINSPEGSTKKVIK